MTNHYDSLETRDPSQRESETFAKLPGLIARAMTAPGWAKHLAGVDPKSVTSRAALAKLPLLRKSDLPRLQAETPPFGGFNVTPPGKAKRLLMSPGPIFEPEGHGKDFAGVARAMFAAGFREGQIVLNCFSYHLTPGAWMFESARAGARLRRSFRAASAIPNSRSRRSRGFRPDGYTGTPDFLKILLDAAQGSPARTHPRSSAGSFRVRRCRRRCGRNCRRAESRCCNAMPPPRPA